MANTSNTQLMSVEPMDNCCDSQTKMFLTTFILFHNLRAEKRTEQIHSSDTYLNLFHPYIVMGSSVRDRQVDRQIQDINETGHILHG